MTAAICAHVPVPADRRCTYHGSQHVIWQCICSAVAAPKLAEWLKAAGALLPPAARQIAEASGAPLQASDPELGDAACASWNALSAVGAPRWRPPSFPSSTGRAGRRAGPNRWGRGTDAKGISRQSAGAPVGALPAITRRWVRVARTTFSASGYARTLDITTYLPILRYTKRFGYAADDKSPWALPDLFPASQPQPFLPSSTASSRI